MVNVILTIIQICMTAVYGNAPYERAEYLMSHANDLYYDENYAQVQIYDSYNEELSSDILDWITRLDTQNLYTYSIKEPISQPIGKANIHHYKSNPCNMHSIEIYKDGDVYSHKIIGSTLCPHKHNTAGFIAEEY